MQISGSNIPVSFRITLGVYVEHIDFPDWISFRKYSTGEKNFFDTLNFDIILNVQKIALV